MAKVTLIKQYSVFLRHQPGALKNFAELFEKENVNIIAISQDVRYDAAVVRAALEFDSEEIDHALTKAGLTSVKTDALCVCARDKAGVIKHLTEVLEKENIRHKN